MSNTYSYELIDLNSSEFEEKFYTIGNFNGVNITTPYKIETFKKLSLKSRNANFFGCVNTIKKLQNGNLKGFCTDNIGFMKTIKQFNKVSFNNVLIIGYGGAGQMASKCLMPLCKNLFILIKSQLKLDSLKKLKLAKPIFVNHNEIKKINFDLIINASPAYSNKLNDPPIDIYQLGSVSNVFDLNYFPATTQLLEQALQLGATCKNGVDMLVWQAIAAQKIWNGFECSNKFAIHLINQTANFLEVANFE